MATRESGNTAQHGATPGENMFRRAGIHFTSAMARTLSLLLALALSPVAHALGVIEPDPKPCRCAAKTEVSCNSALACDLFQLPEGQCGDILCAQSQFGNLGPGSFTCELRSSEWELVAIRPSCDSSERECTDEGGQWYSPPGFDCCGMCIKK